MVKITIKTNGDSLLDGYQDEKEKYLDRLGNESVNILKRLSPVDHGTLRNSWTSQKTNEDTRLVTNSREYAPYMFLGTGVYGPKHRPITPRSAKFLQFKVDGQFIRKKSVLGYNANHRWERALEQIKGLVNKVE